MFTQWVIAAVEARELEQMLRAEGLIIERMVQGTPTPMLNPLVRARRDAFDRLLKTTVELGFSPTSRARVRLGAMDAGNRFTRDRD